MLSERFIQNLDKNILEVLREITQDHDQKLISVPVETEREIDFALGCRFEGLRVKYLLHCTIILASERIANRNQIQQLKAENEALKKSVSEKEKIISAYNGSYRQRAKVKSGMKIAKKDGITKEVIQRLKGQGLTVEQIAKKLGCSRSTVWRRLKE